MRHLIFLFTALLTVSGSGIYAQQQTEPWSDDQLLSTEALASRIEHDEAEDLVILTIGPDAIIKGSVDIGPTMEAENVRKLQTYLNDLPKDKEVVIYCGCCPFDRCPNIRPAFEVLNEMGFENARLLDIPRNIKVDWLDKDYPIND